MTNPMQTLYNGYNLTTQHVPYSDDYQVIWTQGSGGGVSPGHASHADALAAGKRHVWEQEQAAAAAFAAECERRGLWKMFR